MVSTEDHVQQRQDRMKIREFPVREGTKISSRSRGEGAPAPVKFNRV